MSDVRKLADLLQPNPRARTGAGLRQGVVTVASPVTVRLGGETTPTVTHTLGSYTPVVNDTVWVLVDGRTRLVLGKVQ